MPEDEVEMNTASGSPRLCRRSGCLSGFELALDVVDQVPVQVQPGVKIGDVLA